MNATRRLSIAALVVACLHLVFGAIVRISGSGMGCGDHWPKCYGYWFPPFDRPDLIVEVSHRYLASILTFTVVAMAFVAWRNRGVIGIGGRGGAMRSAFGAVGAVLSAAILGGVTVKMGNAPWATVAHWLVAMTLLAMVATTAIRAGALGGAGSLVQRGSDRARRSALIAAGLAILAVALGGLTAKYPGAAVGCTTVPFCGPNPTVEKAGVHVQMTHRTLAVLLVLHLVGIVISLRKRRGEEAPVVVRAAYIALGMGLLQLVIASAMVLFHLPAVLRSLHEATGVGIWLSCFALAYLARRASKVEPSSPAVIRGPAPVIPPSVPSAPVVPTSKVEEPAVVIVPDAPVASSEASAVALADLEVEQVDEEVDEEVDKEETLAELDWEPRSATVAEELDEFSVAALEAEVLAAEALAAEANHSERSEDSGILVAEVEAAEDVEGASVAPSAAPASLEVTRDDDERATPTERVAGESTLVAPPVVAPPLSPLPPVPTMAVLVARGADFL